MCGNKKKIQKELSPFEAPRAMAKNKKEKKIKIEARVGNICGW